MNLTLDELNELYYCVGTALAKGTLVNREKSMALFNRIGAEIEKLNELLEPEYDSAGFTEEDRIIDGQYKTTEIERLMDAEANAVQRWG
jgi:hypothetical protein